MPDVGADSDEGVLAAWLVEEAARFDAAQTIAHVETHDELFSVEAGRPGILLRALVQPGTPVAPGTPIGVLGEVWEEVHDVDALLVELGVVQRATAGRLELPPHPFPAGDPLSVVTDEEVPAEVLSRTRTAGAHTRVEGGPVDVPSARSPSVEVSDAADAQHHYLRATVRVDRLVRLAGDLEREEQREVTVIDLVGRAVAGAHRQVPQLGVARLEQDPGAAPGIPVTHPGRFGVHEAAAVVPQGQVAALSVGAVRDEPVLDGTAVVGGKVMTLTLSVKPGGVDDVPAARWLAVLVALLERPEWMVE
jgi:pyruvate/2-oxoglutarate dehydrogenase complex dihydrolipoamide acyltransferase (E2) component